ncbi:MAG: hypothetical protein PVG66_04550 [Chromatiales bacterium]|jgi:hypothetical protein
MIQHSRARQTGQSMTEFVIGAAFVMVPLFIIVPTVGKFVDMKLATVQSARYVTWEYSANYVDLKDQPAGFSEFSAAQLPKKSLTQVNNEAQRRFYSDTSLPLSSTTDKNGYDVSAANPLWTYHNGLKMYDSSSLTSSGSDATPDKLHVLSGLIGVVGTALNFIASAYNALGINAGFDAINPDGNISIDGKYSTKITMPVVEAPSYAALKESNRKPLFGQTLNLNMHAKSGLLTETWGAGGKAHTVYQAGGLIPTLLIHEAFNVIPLQTIASTVLLSPELDNSSLKFGYPTNDPEVMDMVPKGAIEGENRDDVSCPGGYCEN